MAGFMTLQCNHESSSQGTHKVLCELKGGGHWEVGKRPHGRDVDV